MEIVTSWVGLIVILAAGHGNFTSDLVSLIEPADYFKSRKIEINADRMLELAGKNPSDGKTQIAQLLAIRWLGAHKAEGERAHSILGQIAGGEKAQDPSGFARDYAQRALARIEGKITPARQAVAADSLREDAWKWFPDDVSILVGLELQALGELPAPNEDRMRSLVRRAFPLEAREELYKAAGQIGNLRLDRVSLAFAGTKAKSEIIYLRFTGTWDPKRLAVYLRQQIPGGVSIAKKGGEGESIILVSSKESAPAFAFIGRKELIAAAYLLSPAKPMALFS
jgi:hypothetical protein